MEENTSRWQREQEFVPETIDGRPLPEPSNRAKTSKPKPVANQKPVFNPKYGPPRYEAPDEPPFAETLAAGGTKTARGAQLSKYVPSSEPVKRGFFAKQAEAEPVAVAEPEKPTAEEIARRAELKRERLDKMYQSESSRAPLTFSGVEGRPSALGSRKALPGEATRDIGTRVVRQFSPTGPPPTFDKGKPKVKQKSAEEIAREIEELAAERRRKFDEMYQMKTARPSPTVSQQNAVPRTTYVRRKGWGLFGRSRAQSQTTQPGSVDIGTRTVREFQPTLGTRRKKQQ